MGWGESLLARGETSNDGEFEDGCTVRRGAMGFIHLVRSSWVIWDANALLKRSSLLYMNTCPYSMTAVLTINEFVDNFSRDLVLALVVIHTTLDSTGCDGECAGAD